MIEYSPWRSTDPDPSGSAPRPVLTESQSEHGGFSALSPRHGGPAARSAAIRFPECSRTRAAALWVAHLRWRPRSHGSGRPRAWRSFVTIRCARPRSATTMSGRILEDQSRSPLGRHGRRPGFARSLDRRFHPLSHDGERRRARCETRYVMSLYEDSSGLVWIGTRRRRRQSLESPQLGARRPSAGLARRTSSSPHSPMPRTTRVWIASLGGGLVRFDAETGEATDIDTIVGQRNALGDRRVMALHQDRAWRAVDRHDDERTCAS